MTTETRQFVQYVAVGLFAVFTIAVIGVFVYGVALGRTPDGTVLAYLGAIMGVVTGILGVSTGGNITTTAIEKATASTAGAIAAANGNASRVAAAIHQANTPPPSSASPDSGGA